MSEPRPEGADLGIVDALAQMTFLVQGALARRASAHDVSMIQTRLLGILRDRTPTMNQLAALLDLDKSSVTGLVDRAAARGLVVRVPSDQDRRAVLVQLTDEGRDLIAVAAADFASDISVLVEGLSASERAILSRLASRIIANHAPLP